MSDTIMFDFDVRSAENLNSLKSVNIDQSFRVLQNPCDFQWRSLF